MKGKSIISGFTIIEILIAMALLSMVVISISIPLIGLDRVNQASRTTLSGTSQAQRDIESARQSVVSNYASPPTNLGSGITCTNINVFGEIMTPSSCSENNNPPIRRLTLNREISRQSAITLSLDVMRP